MSDLNKTILIGRLTKDAELRHTQSGTAVAEITLAVNKTYVSAGEKKEEVSFIKCTAWGTTAEALTKYAKKGHRIGVDGRLKQTTWEDKDGKKRSQLEVVIEAFHFLQEKSKPGEVVAKSFDESEIPF